MKFSRSASFTILLIMVVTIIIVVAVLAKFVFKKTTGSITSEQIVWNPPDSSRIPFTEEGKLIRYGRDLISNTSFYLGPEGKIAAITNGMNCQNCHLDAGTKLWGNNYSAVFSTYPKFRERSGTIENIHKRVNDCVERSLNGNKLDTDSREMQAIAAYIQWLGQNVPRNMRPEGVGIRDLPFLSRAADPLKGRIVFEQKCQRCHGSEGNGLLNADSTKYVNPPLWGRNSYNTGAGLYRLSRFAGYVKDNMPFGASHNSTQLSDEEAWDVAAFVNSQPRPTKDFNKDWPALIAKPFDHPFGPYADSFSELQHKYGPFEPIVAANKKMKNKNTKPL